MDRRNFLRAGLIGILAAPAQAQFGKLKPPKIPGVKLPEIDGQQFLKHTPPLTTNLADVYEAVPGFDDYLPTDAAPLTLIPRNADGDYLTLPGLFEIVAESFCLKAGSNPPSKNTGRYGSGYLYAPLKGPKAGQIERILLRSEDHPEIPQYEIQVLLWAIIAEHKLSECPKTIQQTARVLLDERDRRGLENDVLAVVPAQLRGKAYGSLPPLVRDGLEAENKMRELLAEKFADASGAADQMMESTTNPGQKVSALYAQMEQIAMRVGPLPEVSEREKVPWGRWSWHPDGFYIRIFPNGYSISKRQLYYPEAFSVTGNALSAPDGVKLTVAGSTLTLGKATVTFPRPVSLSDDARSLVALRQAAFEAEGKSAEARPISDFLARAALSALATNKKVASSGTTRNICGPGGFGSGGGGGAGMGAPGTQRLAQSRKPKDPPSIDKARDANKLLQKFGSAAKAPGIPLALADKLVNWQLDMGATIDRALHGESTPDVKLPGHAPAPESVCGAGDDGLGIVSLPRPRQIPSGKEPKALFDARLPFSDALARLCEVGKARQIAEAQFAQNRTAPGGLKLLALRRRWGLGQLAVADAGEALASAYERAGGADSAWTPESWAAYRASLTKIIAPADRASARAVGLTDAEIDALQTERLRVTEMPDGGALSSLREWCAVIRESGTDYAKLPEPPHLRPQT